MQSQIWHPLLPSHYLRAGQNIVAGFLQGHELAIWRSETGSIQAWENRCPHRGTRLTLGRIINDNLSCAYHGWEFAPAANCVKIPANPSLPLPKNLRVKTYPVIESDGMVWVAKEGVQSADVSAMAAPRIRGTFFCRSLGVSADVRSVAEQLKAGQFKSAEASAWEGEIAGLSATALLNEATSRSTIAYVWLKEKPGAAQLVDVMGKLRLFRRDAETRMISRTEHDF